MSQSKQVYEKLNDFRFRSFVHYIFKTCQIVAGTNMTRQFHEFFSLIFGGFLPFSLTRSTLLLIDPILPPCLQLRWTRPSDSYYIVSPRSLQSNTYYCSTYLSTEGRASDYLLKKSKKKNLSNCLLYFCLCSAHDLQKWPTNLSNRRSF